ncbi:MAG: hypothetical protein IE931_03505 [Sphingobacteriales bacterium]|nr:hypothetical protein [Sphingobacteriales bacterium]
MPKERIKRGLTPRNILDKNFETFDFENDWFDAFDKPEKYGLYFIWGDSGNGKTSFIMQVLNQMSKHGKTVFNSLEEGISLPLKKAIKMYGLGDKKKILIVSEPMADLIERLDKTGHIEVVVIDSWQYMNMSFNEYLAMERRFPKITFIVISQADGRQPEGRPAKRMMFHAKLKIWIEGYVAFSKGRFIGEKGLYSIWDKGAALYHGNDILNKN